ncbi:MAG: hypothetical protein KKH72_11140 [Alphaproteobacteria bacterium]|nr:hypothetical protein [Alphaproteobacteria bacterium]
MLLDILGDALQVLLHWQFWAVGVGSGLAILALMIIAGLLAATGENNGIGCLVIPVVWVAPVVISTIGIILLLPLMITRSPTIAFSLLQQIGLWNVLYITGAGFLASLLVAFVPLIGQLQSVLAFAQASTVVAVSANIISHGQVHLWPGFFMSVALAAISLIITSLFIFCITVLLSFFKNKEEYAQLGGMALGSVTVFIPATVYCSWIRIAS